MIDFLAGIGNFLIKTKIAYVLSGLVWILIAISILYPIFHSAFKLSSKKTPEIEKQKSWKFLRFFVYLIILLGFGYFSMIFLLFGGLVIWLSIVIPFLILFFILIRLLKNPWPIYLKILLIIGFIVVFYFIRYVVSLPLRFT